MDHHTTWFSFLPFFKSAEHFVEEQGWHGLAFGGHTSMQHVFAAALVCLILIVMSMRARSQLNAAGENALIPDPNVNMRNFFEFIFEKLYAQMKTIIGDDAARYFPVIVTLALFIFFSNILGLFPGFIPPTDNWNTTMACGAFVFLYYNWHGMRANGMGHLAHMANPAGTWWGWFLMPLMLPIEIFGHVLRPFTLGVRLAANMTGDHIVVATFLGLVPILVPLPVMALGLFVCIVQTAVFVLLSIVYISLAVADQHHDDHGDEHHAEAHAH